MDLKRTILFIFLLVAPSTSFRAEDMENVQWISALEVGETLNCTKAQTFQTAVSSNILRSLSCIKIDARSNFGEFGVTISNEVTQLKETGPSLSSIFMRIGGLFSRRKVKKSESPVIKTFCLTPFKPKFVKLEPSMLNSGQKIFITTTMQSLDFACLFCLVAGLVLFYQAKRLSHSTAFYLTTGTGLTIFGSVLLVLFMLSRLIPRKRSVLYASFIFGGLPLCGWVYNRMKDDLIYVLYQHYYIALGYVLATGFTGFSISYRYGNDMNPKTHKVMQWMMQLVALFLIFNGTQLPQVSLIIIGGVLAHQMKISLQKKIEIANLTISETPKRFNKAYRAVRRLFDVNYDRPRLLTLEEYQEQGRVETEKALAELRKFCTSPNCSPWKTAAALRSPKEFSSFVEGINDHVSDETRLLYDNESDDYYDDDDEETGDSTSHENTPRSFGGCFTASSSNHNGFKFSHIKSTSHAASTAHNMRANNNDQFITDDEDGELLTDDEGKTKLS